jgi:UDP-N-acetylmuramoyl-tripeptide--D-alanyl-D-alanine ligase
MKKLLEKLLANKARNFLAKHHPIVIGVTGSVGKTSTRQTIATILSAKYSVVSSKENYNNELGLPLSILGAKSQGKNLFGWLGVLLSSPKKPADVYVLEYGIDHPGDMDHLVSIAVPSIAVMTALSPVHVEFFSSMDQLGEEKAKLLSNVPADGLVVLNADDVRVVGLGSHASAPIVTYGFSEVAAVRALDYSIETRSDFSFEPGEEFSEVRSNVLVHGESIVITLINQLGKSAVSSVLAAVTIAKHLGLSTEEILSRLDHLKQEPGRMNPIPGIKGSLIIDSTYNAAPASMMSALSILSEFEPVESARRIAVLGHMAELGVQSEQEHRMVGMRAAEVCDRLITVGEMAHHIRHAAIEAGMPEERTEEFADPVEAGRWLDHEIKKGDIVLVKGSQSARMEKVVKDVMAEPLRAKELLVRQSKKWNKS